MIIVGKVILIYKKKYAYLLLPLFVLSFVSQDLVRMMIPFFQQSDRSVGLFTSFDLIL